MKSTYDTNDHSLTRNTLIAAISFGALGAYYAFLIIFVMYFPSMFLFLEHPDNTTLKIVEHEVLRLPSWLPLVSPENLTSYTTILLSPLIPLTACFVFIVRTYNGSIIGLTQKYPLKLPILTLVAIGSLFVTLFACTNKAIMIYIWISGKELYPGIFFFIIFFLAFEGIIRIAKQEKPKHTIKHTLARLVFIALSFSLALLVAIILKTHIMDKFFPLVSHVEGFYYPELKEISPFHILSVIFMFSIIGSVLMLASNGAPYLKIRRAHLIPATLFTLYVAYISIFIATENKRYTDKYYDNISKQLALKPKNENLFIGGISITLEPTKKDGTTERWKSQVPLKLKTYRYDIPSNIETLKEYFKVKNNPDWQIAKDMGTGIHRYFIDNWMINEYREFCIDIDYTVYAHSCSYYLTEGLAHFPVNESNLKILNTLIDEKIFKIDRDDLVEITNGLISAGRLTEARRWYEKSLKEAYPSYIPKDWKIPDKVPFKDGIISGRITGIDVKGSRIGLYPLSTYLVDAKFISPDGTFTFTNLPEGTYKLGLLLPQGVDGRFTVKGGGLITIDSKHRRATINAEISKITEKK